MKLQIVETNIITDRIRRLGEGNVFSLFTPGGTPTRSRRGRWVPQPGPDWGGVPWPGPDGGVPQVRYPPDRSGWGGVPRPGPDRGYPKVGTPLPGQDGGGYPNIGTPQGRYPPPPEIGPHMEYLIRCGQYASCVHAGGLSCLLNGFLFPR